MTRAAFFLTGLLGWITLIPAPSRSQSGWVSLLNGKDLEGWESIGDGLWTVMRDGTLVGQRDLRRAIHQAWLYTKKEFGEFDLQLEYWIRHQGNSGVSFWDTSRAQWAVGTAHDPERTPSHIGYEVQINMGYPDKYPSGSIYLFASARPGVQRENDWNHLEIRARKDGITVFLNGELVCQHPGDPNRPKRGPIGLQLHDRQTVVMFRNIRIRELGP
ncbi:MAG: DUF1080 domain-containing protein [Bryobacterales bacterium]|nr:DUF1080 domain-containing protein [Bryobacteraceae bacterium]MDW8354364.1 DUF1080 domain-containing protein [Bryobacterales bacterium]